MAATLARLFISHSSADRPTAERLATDLARLGHQAWIYEWEVRVGESIVGRMDDGLDEADYVVLLISERSLASEFVRREWLPKYFEEILRRRTAVLPALLEDTELPISLRDKRYADFRNHYLVGFTDLVTSLQPGRDASGVDRYYQDFVDITDEWGRQMERSRSLDLFIMYGYTWRNTYRKEIERLVARPDGRLRVVLPAYEAGTDADPLVAVHARRLNISESDMRTRIADAVADFGSLAGLGRVEIYLTTIAYNHALYLFDHAGVIALYALSGLRSATPAWVVSKGGLLRFARQDYEQQLARGDPHCRRIR